MPISAKEMAVYKATARRRWEAEKQRNLARHAHAWELARAAAVLLKRDFQVTRVVVFGSLLHPHRFDERSDVDLAAWGLTTKNWLKAMAGVHELSRDIELNVVDVARCSPELLAVIEQEGEEV